MASSDEFHVPLEQEEHVRKCRRRQSDARWRANLASCYETLKLVIPFNTRASKRQISKALILRETSKHISFLEHVLVTILQEQGRLEGCTDVNSWCASRVLSVVDSFKKRQRAAAAVPKHNVRNGSKYRSTRHLVHRYRRKGDPAVAVATSSNTAVVPRPISLTFPSVSGGFHQLTMESPGNATKPAIWVYQNQIQTTVPVEPTGFESTSTPSKKENWDGYTSASTSGFTPVKLSPTCFPCLSPMEEMPLDLLTDGADDGFNGSDAVGSCDQPDDTGCHGSIHSLLCNELMWQSDDDSCGYGGSIGCSVRTESTPRSTRGRRLAKARGKVHDQLSKQLTFDCAEDLDATDVFAPVGSYSVQPVSCGAPRKKSASSRTPRVAKRCRRSLETCYGDHDVAGSQLDASLAAELPPSEINGFTYDSWLTNQTDDPSDAPETCDEPLVDPVAVADDGGWLEEWDDFVAETLNQSDVVPSENLPQFNQFIADSSLVENPQDSSYDPVTTSVNDDNNWLCNNEDNTDFTFLSFDLDTSATEDHPPTAVTDPGSVTSYDTKPGSDSTCPLLSLAAPHQIENFASDIAGFDVDVDWKSDVFVNSLAADVPLNASLFPPLPAHGCCPSGSQTSSNATSDSTFPDYTSLLSPAINSSFGSDRALYYGSDSLSDESPGFVGQYSPLFGRILLNI